VHFVAGPWFTVQTSGSDWKLLDTIWISNGKENAKARVELKVELTTHTIKNNHLSNMD